MLRNTAAAYGSVSKWLHWLVALWFLVAYVSVYVSIWFLTREDWLHPITRQLHVTFGSSVLLLAGFRLYWRLTNPVPAELPMSHWQSIAAKSVHWLLYFFMFAMPISGYLGYGGKIDFVAFELPTFNDTAAGQWLLEVLSMSWDDFEERVDYFHKNIAGAWFVWILITIHAAAALHHHIFVRDDTLRRMLPGRDV